MPVTFDFHDKVALVTGVGRVGQIGHAVALALGRAGARLVSVMCGGTWRQGPGVHCGGHQVRPRPVT
jgi:NAD(P)-dependent dehydrogenase (short-subunit alcohol dehydrogenase family)